MATLDPMRFRGVLGACPTSVCIVTAIGTDGVPAAMVVGSFTSVSLDPPLVGFFPARTSGSWPRIEAAGGFCVNVLAAGQRDLCDRVVRAGPDKLRGVAHRASPRGAPVLYGVAAWIDCTLESVTAAGDHYFVLGRVTDLAAEPELPPLVFHRGRFASLAAI